MSKYLDLAREMKARCNIKVTVIIAVGAQITVPKSLKKRLLEQEIRGRIETLQTTVVEIGLNALEGPGKLRKLRILENFFIQMDHLIQAEKQI